MSLGINTKVLIQANSLVYLFESPVSSLRKQTAGKERRAGIQPAERL